eukprot:6485099-Amphidinium_carterae.1
MPGGNRGSVVEKRFFDVLIKPKVRKTLMSGPHVVGRCVDCASLPALRSNFWPPCTGLHGHGSCYGGPPLRPHNSRGEFHNLRLQSVALWRGTSHLLQALSQLVHTSAGKGLSMLDQVITDNKVINGELPSPPPWTFHSNAAQKQRPRLLMVSRCLLFSKLAVLHVADMFHYRVAWTRRPAIISWNCPSAPLCKSQPRLLWLQMVATSSECSLEHWAENESSVDAAAARVGHSKVSMTSVSYTCQIASNRTCGAEIKCH